MADTVVHVVLCLAGVMAAWFCLRRGWQLGRDGIDPDGNIRNAAQYGGVRIWGALGIGAVVFVLIDLVAIFKPFALFDPLHTSLR